MRSITDNVCQTFTFSRMVNCGLFLLIVITNLGARCKVDVYKDGMPDYVKLSNVILKMLKIIALMPPNPWS